MIDITKKAPDAREKNAKNAIIQRTIGEDCL